MLIEPGPTHYDLHFHLFGTPVRVHPLFWLFSAILGWDFLELGFVYLFIWVACCFLSILLHEFGHVWMGMTFGARDSYIVLYSFGGLAVGSNDLRNRWQRIAVSLAGPGIQLLCLWLPLWLWMRSAGREQLVGVRVEVLMAIIILQEINLIWPLFNLLPVWPLDGGMVSRELCKWISPRGGLRFSLGLSIAVAGFIAIHALIAKSGRMTAIPYLPTSTYGAILFGILAYQSWQLLQQARMWQAPVDERLPWESDADAWKR
jgi:stage IV sporulation protein FB